MAVSLIVSTYNRAHLLEKSLSRLTELTVPAEVIVVDDGGMDDTEAVCRSFEDRLPIRYVWLDHPGVTNCCYARNCGLRLALHDDFILTEPELYFDTDVVSQLLQARIEDPVSILCAEYCWSEPYEAAPRTEYTVQPGGYVNCYRREWLVGIGGWDESLRAPYAYDDNDIHTRLTFLGHSQVKWPGIVATHLWHPRHPMSAEGTMNPNRALVESKVFPADLTANIGKPWGVLRPPHGLCATALD